MLTHFRPAFSLLLLMTALTGAAYPALVTGIAQTVMPNPANGSMIEAAGKPAGSRLIGQPFSDPGHFWSRPSATGPRAAGISSGRGPRRSSERACEAAPANDVKRVSP